jgi:glycine cleavage system H protein
MRYTQEHHWLRAESGFVFVGITPFAVTQLGLLVFVELPQMGESIAKGDEVAVVESSKAVSDISAPISGDIVAINAAVVGNPSLVNEDPMGGGWLFKMSVSNPSEIDNMMDEAGYAAFTG